MSDGTLARRHQRAINTLVSSPVESVGTQYTIESPDNATADAGLAREDVASSPFYNLIRTKTSYDEWDETPFRSQLSVPSVSRSSAIPILYQQALRL